MGLVLLRHVFYGIQIFKVWSFYGTHVFEVWLSYGTHALLVQSSLNSFQNRINLKTLEPQLNCDTKNNNQKHEFEEE